MSLLAKHTTSNEIKHLISKLKPRKSPGYDLITKKYYNTYPIKFYYFSHLSTIPCWDSHFPPIWTFSIVIFIHKPGKLKHLSFSYRPISLLSVLAKLFEKIILKKIRPLILSKNILPYTQFGFKSPYSRVHQMHRIINKIQISFKNKKYCPGVFLDVAQAFDRVWHESLLYKLKLFLPAPY